MGNTENKQSRTPNNQWNNSAGGFAITVYYCYEQRGHNTDEKRWLKIQLVQMKAV